MRPAKAQINGRVTAADSHVRFTMEMRIFDSLVTLYQDKREMFHQRMEYHLSALVSAVPGQFHCSFVQSTTNGIAVLVDIQSLGLDQETYAPHQLASNIEYAISTGEINDDIFFRDTIITSVTYENVEESSSDDDLIGGIDSDGVYELSLLALVAMFFALL